jgi:hypothetical protein
LQQSHDEGARFVRRGLPLKARRFIGEHYVGPNNSGVLRVFNGPSNLRGHLRM